MDGVTCRAAEVDFVNVYCLAWLTAAPHPHMTKCDFQHTESVEFAEVEREKKFIRCSQGLAHVGRPGARRGPL